MLRFILRRTAYSVLIVIGVVLLTFLLFNVGAGDPAAAVLGKNARPAEVEALRRELGGDLPLLFGFDCRTEAFVPVPGRAGRFRRAFPSGEIIARVRSAGGGREKLRLPPERKLLQLPPGSRAEFFREQANPFHSQFFLALGQIVRFKSTFPYVEFFDFGRSITTREPIRRLLLRGMGPSLLLMLPVFFGEMLFGVALALVAVAFRNRWPDRLLLCLSVAGMSVSYIVVIILAQWFLGYYCEWFPLWGYEGPANLLLPVTVGILCGVGANVRFYRTVFADELTREYLRTAVAKGASPLRVYGKHLLRNAALQIITRAGAGLPFLFTGSLLLESFFGIPGLGYAGVEALYNSDIALLKALVVTSALLFVVINLLADLAYAWADPRIRLE